MDAFEKLVDSLPVPGVDERPPYVEMTERERRMAVEAKWEARALLNPKTDTEKRVKYVLESLLGMKLRKSGDMRTTAGGREFWQKEVADYVGYTPGPDKNYHTYVEVKGISPGGKSFSFGRLDRRNNPRQPSQDEKLTEAWGHGNLVFLAIGLWFADHHSQSTKVKRGSRKVTKWYRDDLKLEIWLIPWDRWKRHVEGTKRRSITRMILGNEFGDCHIFKDNNRWILGPDHWWSDRYEAVNPMFGSTVTC